MDILDYEGIYQASNLGRIRSLENSRKKKGRVLKTAVNKRGYHTVTLSKNGVRKGAKVHRLVWSAFNGPIPEGMQINHIDENPLNNKLDNLNLMAPKENCNWGTASQRMGAAHKKPILQLDKKGKLIKKWDSATDAAQALRLNVVTIRNCCAGKNRVKSTGGFIWRYASLSADQIK